MVGVLEALDVEIKELVSQMTELEEIKAIPHNVGLSMMCYRFFRKPRRT